LKKICNNTRDIFKFGSNIWNGQQQVNRRYDLVVINQEITLKKATRISTVFSTDVLDPFFCVKNNSSNILEISI